MAKFCDQLDLLVGKGTNFLAVHCERADQFILLQHGHRENGPHTPEFDAGDKCRMPFLDVSPFCCEIGDVNHRFGRQHATGNSLRIGTILRAPACFGGKGRWCIACGDKV